MPDGTWLLIFRLNIPQLFDANGKSLRVFAFTQIKGVKQAFGQMPRQPSTKIVCLASRSCLA